MEATQGLALFDLDNTLIDREAAFRAWASRFVEERGLDESAVSWLSSIDDDGVKPREKFFAEIRDRYTLTDSVESLVQGYRAAIATLIPPLASETSDALRTLRSRGWKLGIVTNGSPTQEAHLLSAGLGELVDGYAISSVVGARKPDPRLFIAAADRCAAPLTGGWMVGDRADADIAGAIACGLSSAWISRGRTWEEADFQPDLTADSVAQAITLILSRT